jgi:hypothetical protein
MKPKPIAIVGTAETTRLASSPKWRGANCMPDAALNAMAEVGLKPSDIDGVAKVGETPVTITPLPRHHPEMGRRPPRSAAARS